MLFCNTSSVCCVVCSPPQAKSPSITIYPFLYPLLPPPLPFLLVVSVLLSDYEDFLKFMFYKDFYLFIFRERREGEREGEKHQRERETSIGCLLYVSQPETKSTTQACVLTPESNGRPFILQNDPQTTGPQESGKGFFFLIPSPILPCS